MHLDVFLLIFYMLLSISAANDKGNSSKTAKEHDTPLNPLAIIVLIICIVVAVAGLLYCCTFCTVFCCFLVNFGRDYRAETKRIEKYEEVEDKEQFLCGKCDAVTVTTIRECKAKGKSKRDTAIAAAHLSYPKLPRRRGSTSKSRSSKTPRKGHTAGGSADEAKKTKYTK